MTIPEYPFVGTNLTSELYRKFNYLCAKKETYKSKMLLALIMAATKKITNEEVNEFYKKKNEETETDTKS